jgi:hypothetical protein
MKTFLQMNCTGDGSDHISRIPITIEEEAGSY